MPEESLSKNQFAIIGEEDIALGFRALGFKVYPFSSQADLKSTLDEIMNEKIAVCLIQEDIYSKASEQINNYKYLPLPVFVPFTKDSETTLLDKILKDIRLKATGAL